jgi:hypothetical protein
MAEPTQYSFDLKEVAECLLRKQGIKEGQWVLTFQLVFGAGIFGQAEEDARPGGLMQVNNVMLERPAKGQPLPPWTVDASKLD